jgi:hypothetical protein
MSDPEIRSFDEFRSSFDESLRYEPEASTIAHLPETVESGFIDLADAVEIAVREIARQPVRNHFAEVGGEVGRQLRMITYFAIHDPTCPHLASWLQSGDAWIDEGIRMLVACAEEHGLETDDLPRISDDRPDV